MSTRAPQTIPVAEAVSLAQTAYARMSLTQLRANKGLFEAVDPDPATPESQTVIHTNQKHGETECPGEFVVQTEFRVTVPLRGSGVQGGTADIHLVFVTLAVYTMADSGTNAEAETAAMKIQAVIQSWPYWREFSQSSLARIGVMSAPAPMLNATAAAGMAGYLKADPTATPTTAPAIPETPATASTRPKPPKRRG